MGMGGSPIYLVFQAQVAVVSRLLAEAFSADPAIHYVCATADTLRIERWFRASLRLHLEAGQRIYAIGDPPQAVVVVRCDCRTPPVGGLARWIYRVWRDVGFFALVNTIGYLAKTGRSRPDASHWVVEFIATDARYRRGGLAAQLLEYIHDEGLRCGNTLLCLETTNHLAREWYERRGYQHDYPVKRLNGITIYVMSKQLNN